MGQDIQQRIMKEIEDLPPFPAIANQALGLINNSRSSASDIGRVISHDPAFTAKVLCMANSAFYGFSRKVTTVSEAISIIGYETLRSIITALALKKFYDKQICGYGLRRDELWKHSVGCAIISRQVALNTSYKNPEEAFVTGLLHDIGKIVLNHFVREEICKIFALCDLKMVSFVEAEAAVLGFDHQEIGGRVGEKWNFSEIVTDAIRFHHHPERAKRAPELTSIIHIADYICLKLGLGIGNKRTAASVDDKASGILGLSEPDIDYCIYSSYDVMEEIEEIFNSRFGKD